MTNFSGLIRKSIQSLWLGSGKATANSSVAPAEPVHACAALEIPAPAVPRGNQVAMKVFNLSLHRSGTQSFQRFMLSHGFNAVHWPGDAFDTRCADAVERLETDLVWTNLGEVLAESQVFSDMPYSFLYRQAFAAYPDAKFLLILRDIREWTDSVRRHLGQNLLSNIEKLQYWSHLNDRFDLIGDYKDEELEFVYLSHLAKVTNFMLENRASFTIFSLHDPELGRRCADYIGFDMIHDFPSFDYHRSEPGWSSTPTSMRA